MRALLTIPAVLALAGCAYVAPFVPAFHVLIQNFTGLTAAEQCAVLNTIREHYPSRLEEFVEEVGTRDLICVLPSGEVFGIRAK